MGKTTKKLNFLSPKKQKKEEQYIGHYEEAPKYMKDNDAITHGYRINFNNPTKIFKSLFMVHNEIVNIWTHLCPAILILLLISYFIFFPISLSKDFSAQKMTLNQSLKSYSDALNNLTAIANMKETKYDKDDLMKQSHESLVKSYEHFTGHISEWKDEMSLQMQDYKSSVKNSLHTKMEQFDELKKNFEQVFVPYVLNEINHKINSTYLQTLKGKLQKIKLSIDSESYNFLEAGHVQTPNPHEVSRWPIVIFLASALTCLMCSTMFHLFYPMSGRAYQMFNRMDYAGINILMAGSSFPPLYYGMYCSFEVALFYLVIICIGASCLFSISLFEWIHRPEHANLKALFFGGFGISLSIPLLHMTINQLAYNNYGDSYQISSSIPFYLMLGASYLAGLYVYTVRCPQRNRPGKFNVCGHSHQIWHICVVFGIIFTYLGALQNFETRKISQCPNIV